MKNYDLYIFTFNQVKKGKKNKKEIVEVLFYESIPFKLSKYLAGKQISLRPLSKKGNLCLIENAYKFIGYNEPWHGKGGKICFCNPTEKKSKISFTNNFDTSIYTRIKKVKLSKDMVCFDNLEDLISDHENNFFNYFLDAKYIWGPETLIPKGYNQITEGIVEKGDYYWDLDNRLEKWTSVDTYGSNIKLGDKIEKTGCLFQGKHKGRKENEQLHYYKDFIIRKK